MGFPDGLLISRRVWISHSLHSCNILSHTLTGLSHMLPQNVKTSRLKRSFVPFSSLCMFYSVALFIFLKYFLFVCISWQRPPCVFITVIFFWSLCQLYYPRLARSVLQVLQGLQFLRSARDVNRKPKIAFHLHLSLIHSVQVQHWSTETFYSIVFLLFIYLLSVNKKGHLMLKKCCKKQIVDFGVQLFIWIFLYGREMAVVAQNKFP